MYSLSLRLNLPLKSRPNYSLPLRELGTQNTVEYDSTFLQQGAETYYKFMLYRGLHYKSSRFSPIPLYSEVP